MTLIECFTDSHIDNIAACLRLQPDRLIMVGDAEKMEIPAQRYCDLLERRNMRTEIILRDVGGMNFTEITAVMDALVREYGDCVIDLTGGEELVVMAVGAVLSGLDSETREGIRVEKFDPHLDAVRDCMDHRRKLPYAPVSLSVEKLIELHGGTLHPDAHQPDVEGSLEQLEAMWRIASAAPRKWNNNIKLLNRIESRLESRMEIDRSVEFLQDNIPDFGEKENDIRELLEQFHNRGIVDNRSSGYGLSYTYCSGVLCECTQKAGNILEIKTLLEGRAVMSNGQPFFQDCRMGVSIDWDGVIHDQPEGIPDTRNEIDVILMHGTTPLFVSCKNGGIGEEELYKLHTVATRFGGPYARKMLIATELNQKSESANLAITQRAWDMDIFLVPDGAKLTKREWQEIFLQAVK